MLVSAKRTWRCREPLCDHGSWSETCDEITTRDSLTERACREIRRRVGADLDTVATIDAFAGYARAIRDTLPDAVLVVDHFHASRLASEAVNDVRRRVQQATTGHRGRKGDALYGIRRLLLMTWRNLNDKGWDKLCAGLAAGDPDGG